jgi:predicted alpha/beta-fold hydrolase
VSVLGARGAHGSQEKARKPAVTPATDDQHLRVLAGVKQYRSGGSVFANGAQVGGAILAEHLIDGAS